MHYKQYCKSFHYSNIIPNKFFYGFDVKQDSSDKGAENFNKCN